MAKRPYAAFIERLSSRFEVIDTTDENEDVGFILSLSRGGEEWVLGLSAVAACAVFARADPVSQVWTDVLTGSSEGLRPDERDVIDGVAGLGLRLLGREQLERVVGLNVAGMEPGQVRVYQALFSAADILPWDIEVFRRLGLA
ncbi:hypothetical protein J4573_03260 [Actinomadura barringtoniae]|uniref:Uncharacterized protein n=1 Tax=Actinomadura barringtoniae TaxID=1427535 RepID=A0A939T271_9ACTN|nr:hypothetical protein [Actinomadura barringtoniae]MBO2446093.1 hypothetical protein [Actinomadura barringtoniae]